MIRVVAGYTESDEVKSKADYVCTGADDEQLINRACDDVADETIGHGTNGGAVCLLGRRFNTGGPIKAYSQTAVFGGYPWGGTHVVAQSKAWGGTAGAPVGMLQLATPDSQYVKFSGLTLRGQNQSVSGVFAKIDTGQEWDGQVLLRDLRIFGVGRSGVELAIGSGGRMRAAVMDNIKVIDPGVSGFILGCPDYVLMNSEVGSAGSHGVVLPYSSGNHIGVKSWFSQGNGFHITGGRDHSFSGCEAQDNRGHGFYVGSVASMFSSCRADSNGKSGAPGTVTGSGFYVTSGGSVFSGCGAAEKNEGGRTTKTDSSYGWQEYGFQLVGSPKVIINGSARGNRSGSITGAGGTGSVLNVIDGY